MRGQPAGANEKYKMNFKQAVHLNNIVISQYWAVMRLTGEGIVLSVFIWTLVPQKGGSDTISFHSSSKDEPSHLVSHC